MKTKTKLASLLVLGLTLAGASTYAQSDNGAPPPQQPPGPGHRPPPIGQVLMDVLNKYDTNHDGALDQNEMATLKQDIQDGKIQPPGSRPPLPKEILEKYDVNHNGVLDESEREALHQDIEAGKIQLPHPEGPGMAGGPGPGAPSAKQLLAKFDTNQDGMLDENELANLLKELPRHRPPMHRGPGGPGGPGGQAPEDASPVPPPQQ